MSNFGKAIEGAIVGYLIITAILGWAVIEIIIWLFSHIEFNWIS